MLSTRPPLCSAYRQSLREHTLPDEDGEFCVFLIVSYAFQRASFYFLTNSPDIFHVSGRYHALTYLSPSTSSTEYSFYKIVRVVTEKRPCCMLSNEERSLLLYLNRLVHL